MVASGQAIAGSLVLGSPSVATAQHSHGVLAVSRKPFGVTLDIANTRSVAINRFDSRHSFPLGKRLRGRSCLRVSALQQSTSTKSVKWVLDPVGEWRFLPFACKFQGLPFQAPFQGLPFHCMQTAV